MIGEPLFLPRVLKVAFVFVDVDVLDMAVWYTTADRDVEWDVDAALGDEDIELFLKVESQVDRYLADKYVPRPIASEVRAEILKRGQTIVNYDGTMVEIFGHIAAVYDDDSRTILITVKGISMIETMISYQFFEDGENVVTSIVLKKLT
jgi:hypothetical protein